MSSLSGKTAVVTGGARGIGRSIVERFAREGADIAICARTQGDLDDTRAAVEALGRKCLAVVTDLSDQASTKAFCDAVLAEYGRIDILVNNAGVYLDKGKIAEVDPDVWIKNVVINLHAPFLVTRHLLEAMNDGAKILNFSTGKALNPGNDASSYHIAKAGLHMLTGCLANELWPRGIDVNNIVPGPTATTTFSREDPANRSTPEALLERYKSEVPNGLPKWERVKHPDEIADLAFWLVSMPEGGPTGQTFSLARRPL
ncbi:SDR family NAD(P)-dependent oxidoreductase [Pacificoceanicola onchidii]|uniref:SDR family NAD(P)-dependent oxidoreductase n=1 Tax=Pacificoceanicola onchidii TaxID=2562685 RepID=UPI001456004C|nr:SDR family oxidoreductase [Pacificoceanicola onchidii]